MDTTTGYSPWHLAQGDSAAQYFTPSADATSLTQFVAETVTPLPSVAGDYAAFLYDVTTDGSLTMPVAGPVAPVSIPAVNRLVYGFNAAIHGGDLYAVVFTSSGPFSVALSSDSPQSALDFRDFLANNMGAEIPPEPMAFVATFGDATTTTVTTDTTDATSMLSSSVYGQTVTLTATVASASTGANPTTPAGSVVFYDGTTALNNGAAVTLDNTGSASLQVSSFSVASHSITATYTQDGVTDTVHDSSTSAALTQTVSAASTTTTLSANNTNTTPNTEDDLTATVTPVSPGSGTPAGTVAFTDANNHNAVLPNCGNVIVSASTGTAICYWTPKVASTPSITAVFTPTDSNFATSTSAALAVTVDADVVTVNLSSTLGSSTAITYGSLPTFYASLSGGDLPTGTLTFEDASGNALCPAIMWTGTQVSCTPSVFNAGAAQVQAVYSGDANNATNTATVNFTVNSATPTVTLTSTVASGGKVQFGSMLSFTATVAGVTNGETPVGQVSFSDALGTQLGGPFTLVNGSYTYTVTTPAAGSYTFFAAYVTDNNSPSDTNYVDKSSSTYPITVTQAPTPTLGIGSSATSVLPNTTVQLTATFGNTVSAAAPSGKVTFLDGGISVGTGNITSSNGTISATFTTAALTQGKHTFTASYAGDTNYPSTATTVSVVVDAEPGTTGVKLTDNATTGTALGDSVTLTATITGATNAQTPTGTVTFTDAFGTSGTSTLCSSVAVSTSIAGITTAQCVTTALVVGSNNVTATYSGDTQNSKNTGSDGVSVASIPTAIALTSSGTPSTYGNSVTITATVTTNDKNQKSVPVTLGSVTFTDGSTTYPATSVDSTAGTATLVTSTLSATTHNFGASYADISTDTKYAPSSTAKTFAQTVNPVVSTVTVTSSSNPSSVGGSVVFTAKIVPTSPSTGVATGIVSFYDGTTLLGPGTLSSGQATYTTAALTAGTHNINVTYDGDGNVIASTGAFSQTVSPNAPTLAVTVSPTPATYGQAETFAISVTGTVSGKTPGGTVVISEGSNVIGTATLAGNGAGAVAGGSFSVGTHTITAVYSGDATYSTTTGTISLVVKQAATTTTLTASNNPSPLGDAVVFSVAVTSTATGVGGVVELLDGSTSLGMATLTNGQATFTLKTLTVGAHALQANYLGNANFATSSSAALTETIQSGSSSADAGVDAGADAGATDGGTSATDMATATHTYKTGGGGCSIDGATGTGGLLAALFFVLAIAATLRRKHEV